MVLGRRYGGRSAPNTSSGLHYVYNRLADGKKGGRMLKKPATTRGRHPSPTSASHRARMRYFCRVSSAGRAASDAVSGIECEGSRAIQLNSQPRRAGRRTSSKTAAEPKRCVSYPTGFPHARRIVDGFVTVRTARPQLSGVRGLRGQRDRLSADGPHHARISKPRRIYVSIYNSVGVSVV
jgi:hypothetical protein